MFVMYDTVKKILKGFNKSKETYLAISIYYLTLACFKNSKIHIRFESKWWLTCVSVSYTYFIDS